MGLPREKQSYVSACSLSGDQGVVLSKISALQTTGLTHPYRGWRHTKCLAIGFGEM